MWAIFGRWVLYRDPAKVKYVLAKLRRNGLISKNNFITIPGCKINDKKYYAHLDK